MDRKEILRREFFSAIGKTAAAGCIAPHLASAGTSRSITPTVGTTTWPWITFATRDERQVEQHTDALLSDIAATGIRGYEPIVEDENDLVGLGAKLKCHGLSMRSAYIEPELHDHDLAAAAITKAVSLASGVRTLGAKLIVTNPAPISWEEPQAKSDLQLRTQAAALNKLGGKLKQLGLTLAYHNHQVELEQGAREFHHMLTGTDPRLVKLCLDADWIYRGCGQSEVAVFDILTNYHPRIVELHLRQSINGVWNESFSMEGDISYTRMCEYLHERSVQPYLVLEQAVEDDSPRTLTSVEAHRNGCKTVHQYLAGSSAFVHS